MGDYEDARIRLARAEMACWKPADTKATATRARWVIAGIVVLVAIAALIHQL